MSDLTIECNSATITSTGRYYSMNISVEIEDCDIDEILDSIGEDKVMEYFGLVNSDDLDEAVNESTEKEEELIELREEVENKGYEIQDLELKISALEDEQ